MWEAKYAAGPTRRNKPQTNRHRPPAGAGSLRGYYSSGMLLFRPDEAQSTRHLIYELRNGPAIETKFVDKMDGQWHEVDVNDRLVLKEYGERLDAGPA